MLEVQDVSLRNNIKAYECTVQILDHIATYMPARVVKTFQMAEFLLWLHWHVLRLKVVVETDGHLWVAMALCCSRAEMPVGRLIHTCCSERVYVSQDPPSHCLHNAVRCCEAVGICESAGLLNIETLLKLIYGNLFSCQTRRHE